MPRATDLVFDQDHVALGGIFIATISGSNVDEETYFDMRFRRPDSPQDKVALNWQRGTSASHSIPPNTVPGSWTIIGIWAHQDANDHSSDCVPVIRKLLVNK